MTGDAASVDAGPAEEAAGTVGQHVQSASPPSERIGGASAYALACLVTLLTAATAFLSVFFLPWRIDSVAVPWVLVLGVAVVFWAANAAFRLTGSLWWAAAPVAGWLVMCGWLSRSVVLGYATMLGDWRGQVLLVVGALAGAVALGLAWGAKTLDASRVARTSESAVPVEH